MDKKPIEEQSAEELRDYIRKKLRPELQQRREANAAYEAAFTQFTPQEQRGLLHIVTQFGEDRASGADLFRQLADSILQDTNTNKEEEEEMTTEGQESENSQEEMPAWAKALMDKVEGLEAQQTAVIEQGKAEGVNAIKAEARALGYEEGTEAWVKFFAFAGNADLANGDLNVAHEMMTKVHPDLAPAPEGESSEEENEEGQEEGAEGEESTSFPKTGAAGGTGAPANGSGEDKVPDLSKEGVAAAAAEYMANFGEDNAATT